MNNYIFEYWQGICDGSIVVGKWVRQLYSLIIERIESGEYIFDQRKANNAIRFIEKFCRHNKGKLAPHLIELALWQKAALSCAFGIVDGEGKRVFTEWFFLIGRKQGKTLLASAIMSYVAYACGEYGSEIYCVAPKLDQTDLVYSAFKFTVDNTPAFSEITKPRKTDLYIAKTNTTVKKIAFNEKKADGYSPMLTVCDECSSWQGDRGLKQYEVMTSGTVARSEPITLTISSSGYANDSIFDELVKRSTRFLMGESKERKLLPFLYMIDDIEKWDDINELRKSLPSLGISVPVQTILDKIDIAHESMSNRAEFICKYADVKQNSSHAWLQAETVRKCIGEHLDLADWSDHYCAVGVDLSMAQDLTAAVAVIKKNGEYYIFGKCWMPAERIDEATERDGLPYEIYRQKGFLELSGENYIDYHDCYKWIVDLIQKYHVYPLKVGFDRYNSRYWVAECQQYGLHMDDVYQGDNLWNEIQLFESLAKDGKIHIGDNDLFKVHMLDAAVKVSAARGRGRLIKINQNAHVDMVAATLDAFAMLAKWHSECGAQWENAK